MRTIAYVDGYNLYYGRLQGTPWKWLDIHALLQHILHGQDPAMTLTRVRYFTAPVIARLASHGHLSLEAQQTYLRALEATGVDVTLSRHQREAGRAPRYNPGVAANRPDRARPPAGSLMQLADWTRTVILDSELAAAQLPARLPTRRKPADKPTYW